MAAQAENHAPSGRFIRAYLLTWGLLAAGGLTYLASLAWHPEFLSPAQRQQQIAEADPAAQAGTKALAELGTVRRTVVEIQNDLGRLKSTIDQREAEEKAAQARLAALEERVTTMATPAAAEPTPAPARYRAIERAKAPADKRASAAEPARVPTRVVTIIDASKTPAAPVAEPKAPVAEPKGPAIETGSITAPAATITFGEPEVTPAQQAFAVQLAAGPSLDALRLSWSLLRERHGSALGPLQPRFVPPRTEGGPYRLLAGPLPSKTDADKVCTDIGVGRKGCFATAYIGQPL